MRTIVLALVLFTCGRAAAGEEVIRYRLEVTPAGRPTPAMRYRLLPAIRDLKPGNSAAQEYRALMDLKSRELPDDQNTISDWLDLSADKFPRTEAAALVSRYEVTLRDLARAARRDRVDWDIPMREDGVETLLNEVQGARSCARLLSLKARLEVLNRDYAKAAETLATTFALARHIGDSGSLIGSLVGIAITGRGADEIREWIGTPGSPNLYWALTALPDPPVAIRSGMQSEELYLTAALPYLDMLDSKVLSRQQADELWVAAGKLLDSAAAEDSISSQLRGTTALLLPAFSMYARAKQHLIAAGRKPELIEAMPVAQVIVLAWVDVHRSNFDEMTAWLDEPYPEAQKAMNEMAHHSKAAFGKSEGTLASLLLPSAQAVYRAEVREAQQIAALRAVEAVRLYAADHDGRLPSSLADISEVPVPRDPATGQPFEYRLKDATATLRPRPVDVTVEYEITVKPGK